VLCLFLSAFADQVFAQQPGSPAKTEQEHCSAYLNQAVPTYRVAWHYKTTGPGMTMYISIAPGDVTRDKLIALGCKLGRDHARGENLFVLILDSYAEAKRFCFQCEGGDRQTSFSFRAMYAFNREPGNAYQSLSWRPDRDTLHKWEQIDLGPPPDRPGAKGHVDEKH